ncbi:MAG: hypothetical protein JWN75_136 [Candidatus Saccharibacteria bacterium]|nr:hypothetical protein [Candidatus Saccharibacteria bacterium]
MKKGLIIYKICLFICTTALILYFLAFICAVVATIVYSFSSHEPFLAFLPFMFYVFWVSVLVAPASLYGFVYNIKHTKTTKLKRWQSPVLFITLVLFGAPFIIFGTFWVTSAQGPFGDRTQYNIAGGPTKEQINAVKMSNVDELQKRLDNCSVERVRYFTFDYRGPEESKNLYINIMNRDNGASDNAPVMPEINLPLSDKDKIITAVNLKNVNFSGSYPSCVQQIEIDPYPKNNAQ